MKIKEIRDLTTEELQLKVTELKKDIAKVLTVIREREINGEA